MTRPSLQDYGTYSESAVPNLWDGVIGAWSPCLGPSGLRVHDFSRFHNWGTLSNMDPATDWVVSNYNGAGISALDFDGTNDYANTSLSRAMTSATAAVWCRNRNAIPGQSNSGPPLSQESSGGQASHYTWIDGIFYTDILRTGREIVTPSALVSRTQWHLLTIVNTGSLYQVYQNNIRIHSTLSTAIRNEAFTLGRSNAATGIYYYDGQVAEAFVWNRALTHTEISDLFLLGPGGMFQRRKRRYSIEFVGGAPAATQAWIKVGGVWKQATPHIKVAGVWKQATPNIKVSGTWK